MSLTRIETEQVIKQRITKETLDWQKRIRYLPKDADEIAGYYANKTRYPSLKEPLKCFLDEVSNLQGLDGLALAIVEEEPFRFLEVYIFENPLAEQAATKAGEAHTRLQRAVRRGHPCHLDTGVWFVPTRSKNLIEIVPGFLDSLATDPWNFNSKNTRFSHFTFLQVPRNSPSNNFAS